MFSKRIVMCGIAASLLSAPAAPVSADIGDGIVGGLVGGAVSGIIVNESAKARERKRATTTRTRTIYRSAPQNTAKRAQVRETQTALNYFGFPAGTPDGVSGRNTRNAVSQYQAHMGYPVTGYITDYERQFLVGSYYRAQSSGAVTAQLIAERGQGTRGLLHAYRDEANGTSSGQMVSTPAVPAAPAAPAVPVMQEQSTSTMAAFSGTTGEAASGGSTKLALPNLMGSQENTRSLASHCNQVSLLTNSNGGFVTEASIQDPRFALNEQFCLARTYAVAAGEKLASGLRGVSVAEIEEQCNGFAPAMRDLVASVSLKPQAEVLQGARSFILEAGAPPEQLAGTAKICLSVGYRTDNMDVALGSALLLTALGEGAYGELLGHHLNEGFGTTKRPDLALAWYQSSFDALERGAEPVFSPGNPERSALVQKAAYRLNGVEDGEAVNSVQPASTLPTFNIDN